MIKISNLRIPAEKGLSFLPEACKKALGLKSLQPEAVKPLRVSVDSRRKGDVCFVCSAAVAAENEEEILKKKIPGVAPYIEKTWSFPYKDIKPDIRPVVCGMGPAGLFAALALAEAGAPPVILERGRETERRCRDVETYWKTGLLDESSNVQFGEGGAGTFSDGKLQTGVNDERIPYVLRQFCRFGAPEDILYSAKPHIGTDMLRRAVVGIRKYLLSLGCDIRFENKLVGIETEKGALSALEVERGGEKYRLPCKNLLLAPGNSARDTFRMLNDAGVALEPKPFAVGVRIEHLQKDVDAAQYGRAATLGTLPASDYKLAVHTKEGRGVFTFCVCPGGQVVAAASFRGGVVTNGMSEKARAGKNINGGLLVSVTPEDFEGLFGGMEFQESLERAAFRLGGENGCATAQLVGDFLEGKASADKGRVSPTYKPGVKFCDLSEALPDFIVSAIREALPEMERKIRGFSARDAVLTAVETRSSSPVRIKRDLSFQASVRGIFPCGEGGGWAGGITSSAVDGLKAAEKLCESIM